MFQVHDDFVTPENREFLKEVVQDTYKNTDISATQKGVTNIEWSPKLQRTGLVARKIGVYPLWLKDGKKVCTTLLQVNFKFCKCFLHADVLKIINISRIS